MHRIALLIVIPVLLSLGGCAQRQVQVLTGPPAAPYRTLGMVSGQGENDASAMAAVGEQAARIDADAVVVESQRLVGRVVIVTGRAIKYLGAPPEPQAAPPPAPQEPPPGTYPPPPAY